MNKSYEISNEMSASYIRHIRKNITRFIPEIALILGSGLGNFAHNIEVECVINYSDLDGFPVTTNKMHKGRFVLGYIGETPVVAMEGRIHYYEGYSMEQVILPVRLMNRMGAEKLIITNAAGGIDSSFTPGDLMLITDHISSFVPSPLIGKNIDDFGTRFPDMTNVYDKNFAEIARKCAKELSINLKEGVYLQVTGPNYETPAEIRAYKALGANAVGMSTACEAMAAVHAGMKVCGISCITNMAAGIAGQALDDKEVGEIAATVSGKFSKLLTKLILSI